MKNYLLNNVVVPFDFSDMSLEALEVTLAMVDSPEKIQVVHVTPYPSEPALTWGVIPEGSITEDLKKAFEKARVRAGLPELEFTSLFGDPGERICDFAKSCGGGLIVISSHGRTGLTRLLLGSVAERVVRLAPCPVLVLRGEQEV